MVSEYSPNTIALYGSPIETSTEEPFEPASFRDVTEWFRHYNQIARKWEGVDPSRVRIIQVRFTDPRTGWAQHSDVIRTASSTAWQEYKRHLLLPPLVKQTTLGTAMNQGAMFYATIQYGPGTATIGSPGLTGAPAALVLAGGNAGSSTYAVFTETSAVNPVPLQFTSFINAVIVSVSAIGASPTGLAGQVIFGHSGGVAAEIATSVGGQGSGSGTNGTMHANTANCWGVLPTNINAATPGTNGLLIYAGTSIYYLAGTSAFTAAPTQTLSNIPGGGTALGVEALRKNWLNRAYWVWPRANTSTSAFSSSQNPRPLLDVISTNLEGTGPELCPTSMTRVVGAALWNRTVVRWDGLRLTSYDGETEVDLQVLEGRAQDSDYRWGISNVTVHGSDLYAWIVRMDMTQTPGTLGSGVLSCEKYLGVPGKWANVSQAISAANSNAGSVSTSYNRENVYGEIDLMHQASCGIPISGQTGFVHLNMYNSTRWDRFWLPPQGINPFNHFVQTGASAEVSQEWAPSAVWTSSKFPLRGFQGLPAVWIGCSAAEMNIAAGGATSTVKMECATQNGTSLSFTGALSETFQYDEPIDTMTRWWPDNTDVFTLGQLQITMTQGSNTRQTMNAVPATWYAMVFLDGQVQAPQDVGFKAWDQ